MIAQEEFTDLAIRTAELSLEARVSEWKRKLMAAQDLRRYYKDSEFARKTISEREKQFKKHYWKACAELRHFRSLLEG